MNAIIVPPPIQMFGLFTVNFERRAITAEISYTDDGSLIVTTERDVKGLKVIGLPRRIDSARELIEALTQ